MKRLLYGDVAEIHRETSRIESELSGLASRIVAEHKCDPDVCGNPLAHGTTAISYGLAARIVELLGDKATATLYYYDEAHDGPGFYYIDDECSDEGSCGAFKTVEEAIAHAGCDYIMNVHESCEGH